MKILLHEESRYAVNIGVFFDQILRGTQLDRIMGYPGADLVETYLSIRPKINLLLYVQGGQI